MTTISPRLRRVLSLARRLARERRYRLAFAAIAGRKYSAVVFRTTPPNPRIYTHTYRARPRPR